MMIVNQIFYFSQYPKVWFLQPGR